MKRHIVYFLDYKNNDNIIIKNIFTDKQLAIDNIEQQALDHVTALQGIQQKDICKQEKSSDELLNDTSIKDGLYIKTIDSRIVLYEKISKTIIGWVKNTYDIKCDKIGVFGLTEYIIDNKPVTQIRYYGIEKIDPKLLELAGEHTNSPSDNKQSISPQTLPMTFLDELRSKQTAGEITLKHVTPNDKTLYNANSTQQISPNKRNSTENEPLIIRQIECAQLTSLPILAAFATTIKKPVEIIKPMSFTDELLMKHKNNEIILKHVNTVEKGTYDPRNYRNIKQNSCGLLKKQKSCGSSNIDKETALFLTQIWDQANTMQFDENSIDRWETSSGMPHNIEFDWNQPQEFNESEWIINPIYPDIGFDDLPELDDGSINQYEAFTDEVSDALDSALLENVQKISFNNNTFIPYVPYEIVRLPYDLN